MSGELTIASGATVTVEPCAEVRMNKDDYLMVRGKLVARGEETRPIAFRRDSACAARVLKAVYGR